MLYLYTRIIVNMKSYNNLIVVHIYLLRLLKKLLIYTISLLYNILLYICYIENVRIQKIS